MDWDSLIYSRVLLIVLDSYWGPAVIATGLHNRNWQHCSLLTRRLFLSYNKRSMSLSKPTAAAAAASAATADIPPSSSSNDEEDPSQATSATELARRCT